MSKIIYNFNWKIFDMISCKNITDDFIKYMSEKISIGLKNINSLTLKFGR